MREGGCFFARKVAGELFATLGAAWIVRLARPSAVRNCSVRWRYFTACPSGWSALTAPHGVAGIVCDQQCAGAVERDLHRAAPHGVVVDAKKIGHDRDRFPAGRPFKSGTKITW